MNILKEINKFFSRSILSAFILILALFSNMNIFAKRMENNRNRKTLSRKNRTKARRRKPSMYFRRRNNKRVIKPIISQMDAVTQEALTLADASQKNNKQSIIEIATTSYAKISSWCDNNKDLSFEKVDKEKAIYMLLLKALFDSKAKSSIITLQQTNESNEELDKTIAANYKMAESYNTDSINDLSKKANDINNSFKAILCKIINNDEEYISILDRAISRYSNLINKSGLITEVSDASSGENKLRDTIIYFMAYALDNESAAFPAYKDENGKLSAEVKNWIALNSVQNDSILVEIGTEYTKYLFSLYGINARFDKTEGTVVKDPRFLVRNAKSITIFVSTAAVIGLNRFLSAKGYYDSADSNIKENSWLKKAKGYVQKSLKTTDAYTGELLQRGAVGTYKYGKQLGSKEGREKVWGDIKGIPGNISAAGKRGWSSAKYYGGRGWEGTKNLGNKGLEKTKSLWSRLFGSKTSSAPLMEAPAMKAPTIEAAAMEAAAMEAPTIEAAAMEDTVMEAPLYERYSVI